MLSTSDRPKRLIIGMSHVIALAAAASLSDGITFINLNDHPEIYDKQSRKIKAKMLQAEGVEKIYLLMGGNMHNILGLLNHPVPFSVGAALASDDARAKGRAVIPEPVMRAVMAERIEFLFRLTREIHARFDGLEFTHVSAPPPLATLDYIKKYPTIIRDKLHLGLSPKPVRKALYDVQCSLYRQQAEKCGALFMSCPAEALDSEGFLAQPFCSDDPTHANKAYGRLVLDEIIRSGARA